MKKLSIAFGLFACLLAGCSGGDDGGSVTTPDPEENTAPAVPQLVYPSNNTLCIDNNVVFEWEAAIDEEGDPVSYTVEVSEESDFATTLYSFNSSSITQIISLEKGKSFFWRVKAKDNKNNESEYSSVNHFLTEGEAVSNHLPFAPTLVAPALNAEIDGDSTTLSWAASDIDGDDLVYDVYLGTDSDPTQKVAEDQPENKFDATGLSPATTYYYKVVVKDGNGGVTLGQVWNFKTK